MNEGHVTTYHPDLVTGEHFDKTMGLVLDKLEAVQDRQMTQQQLQTAFAAGMREALADPKLIEDVLGKVVNSAQRKAAETTGNAVGGFLKSFFTRWLVIAFVLVMVAKTAGLDVAGKVLSTLKGS